MFATFAFLAMFLFLKARLPDPADHTRDGRERAVCDARRRSILCDTDDFSSRGSRRYTLLSTQSYVAFNDFEGKFVCTFHSVAKLHVAALTYLCSLF